MTLSTILQWPEFVNDLKNLKNQYDGPHFTHKEPEVLKSESAQSHVVFQTRLEINSGVLTWYSIWCISLLAYWLSSMVVLLFQKQGFFFLLCLTCFYNANVPAMQQVLNEHLLSELLCEWASVSQGVKWHPCCSVAGFPHLWSKGGKSGWLPWLFLSLSPVQNKDLPPAWEGRGG